MSALRGTGKYLANLVGNLLAAGVWLVIGAPVVAFVTLLPARGPGWAVFYSVFFWGVLSRGLMGDLQKWLEHPVATPHQAPADKGDANG